VKRLVVVPDCWPTANAVPVNWPAATRNTLGRTSEEMASGLNALPAALSSSVVRPSIESMRVLSAACAAASRRSPSATLLCRSRIWSAW
jgi:hypothetical protein